MKYPSGVLFVAVVAISCLAGGGSAQASSNQPASGNVAQQFKSGANRVGEGAVQIGHGIKQGAILTWEALRDGATSAAARFNGGQSASSTSHAQ